MRDRLYTSPTVHTRDLLQRTVAFAVDERGKSLAEITSVTSVARQSSVPGVQPQSIKRQQIEN